MTDLSDYLRRESDFWTDYPHLQPMRPRRAERAQRLAQAAEIVEGYNTMIEELQALCDEFGCLGGQHRINWLREKMRAAYGQSENGK